MTDAPTLLSQAQACGIQIYIQGGQVQVSIPWPSFDLVPEPARYLLRELRGRQAEIIAVLDPAQQEYWHNVLTNAYFLRDPQHRPMRELHAILEQLRALGATLAPDERTLRLRQGAVPWTEWNKHQYQLVTTHYAYQLEWLLKLSIMGYARDYVDLASECPEEWIDDVLGKHGARIAALRADIIAQMAEKNQPDGLCFERADGGRWFLVPCKTGRSRIEITPEESVVIAEAQDKGDLPAGEAGAWMWVKEADAGA